MRQAGHVRRFPPAVDLHGCDGALRMSDRIIAFFVVPHGSGWAPSVLAGDGVALLVAVIGERLAVVDEGFLQSDVLAVGLGDLIAEGGLRYRNDVTEGIENAPAALIGQLSGHNRGKQLVMI